MMKNSSATTPRPTPEQLADAALAALHLHNYLAEPGAPSLFDDLALTVIQRRYLLALADVGAFYVEHRARTAEEIKLEAILRGLTPGDFFYLPDGATSTDATELAELGQSIGVNVVARSERRIGHPPCWRIVCLEPGSDEPSLDEFLAAHTEQGAAFKCKLSDLWDAYRLAHNGEPPLGKRQFGRALSEAGFPYVKVLNYMVRLGLRLKPRPITREEIGLKTE